MEIDREREDTEVQLQSKSVDDVLSCSSSILNTDNDDTGDDEDEDGINVTILSTPPPTVVPKKLDGQSNASSYGKNGTKTKRLSGAGQKRYKKLIEGGHSRTEARLLAQNPPIPSDPPKRPRGSDLNKSNTSDNPTPAKIPRNNWGAREPPNKMKSVQHRLEVIRSEHSVHSRRTEGRPDQSYRDVVNSAKLGILPKGYPSIELTTTQLIATQKAILAKVAGQRKEPVKPKFGDCVFKSGYLIIVCKNKETAEWLKKAITSIVPWPGAELAAVDEKDIPQPAILIGFFPWSAEDSNEEILTLLESQNDGLNSDEWRILQRNNINQRHVELVFTVDGMSLKSIKKSEYTLDFKFGNANLRKKFQRHKHDSSERPEQGTVGDSHTIHVGTGDDKTVVNQIEGIPGPSGVEKTTTNLNTTGHTTNSVDYSSKSTKFGSKLKYRDLQIREEKHPRTGSRKSKVGEKQNPQTCGEQQHPLHQ